MKEFIHKNCILNAKNINLSSGSVSNIYFDCKKAMLHGPFLESLSDWVISCAEQLNPKANIIGGPSIGADFIVAGVIIRANQINFPLQDACIVRKEAKSHGIESKIENKPPSFSRIMVVEDVITTGGSISRACDEFLKDGHTISGIVSIIDRKQGGCEFLSNKYNTTVFSLFNIEDFI